eukprot:GEMP01013473.1.p1 GENE.GEMP01013473.1~~GEMP01013473.1.p1  ORF type:complete len:435 (+),score=35.67 GEMP01013473.1:53-1306(+)
MIAPFLFVAVTTAVSAPVDVNSSLCRAWADAGFCAGSQYSAYMLKYCGISCAPLLGCPLSGIDYLGNNVGETTKAQNWLVCGRRCSYDRECIAWSWNQLSLDCVFKERIDARRAEDVISGHKNCPGCPASDTNNVLICLDGERCDVTTGEKWDCCEAHGGRRQCPLNQPFMCADPQSNQNRRDHGCSMNSRSCIHRGGLLRVCPKGPTVYNNLGNGKCVFQDGGEVDVLPGDWNPGQSNECRNLCDAKLQCGGYSVSNKGICLLYSARQADLKLDSARNGSVSHCMVKAECDTDDDCTIDPDKIKCSNKICVQCGTDADCTNDPDKIKCSNSICVGMCESCLQSGSAWHAETATCTADCGFQDIDCYTGETGCFSTPAMPTGRSCSRIRSRSFCGKHNYCSWSFDMGKCRRRRRWWL